MLCHNLVSKASGLAGGGSGLVDDFTSEAGLKLATDDSIRASVNQLRRCKEIDKVGVFQKRQQSLGFTWNAHGLLSDTNLTSIVEPASQY